MSRRSLTRHQKQAETRSSLLRSAAKLFCRHGLDGASVEEVAHDAGYTKGAFYSNFKSKEELFLVMLDERFAAELERTDRILAGEGEWADEARDAARDFIASVGHDDEWRRLYFEFVAYAMRNDEFRQELATRHRALRERLAAILARWSADFPGEPPVPIADISAMVDFMADGFLLDRMVDPELDEDLYATMLAIFLRGLQAMALGWEPEAAPA
ncbi:MAG TPA: TetR/AcrR family transcriptional regulator [Solirubrobacterales bacterium]